MTKTKEGLDRAAFVRNKYISPIRDCLRQKNFHRNLSVLRQYVIAEFIDTNVLLIASGLV
jgi:hypothetical protein